jgi:hypothetical protein
MLPVPNNNFTTETQRARRKMLRVKTRKKGRFSARLRAKLSFSVFSVSPW